MPGRKYQAEHAAGDDQRHAYPAAPAPDARWYGDEKNGIFQRVLWDEKKMIPLIAETGDRAGTFFRRMEVKPQAALAKHMPWEKLQGYAQKEYADFLD
ncbi:MAG: hypothetical protein HY016_04845 [Nitrosomonadales bacterium]|nr:hypothetical protein [Nitrosomonadales bacterium]